MVKWLNRVSGAGACAGFGLLLAGLLFPAIVVLTVSLVGLYVALALI